jgi:hypothetical protein
MHLGPRRHPTPWGGFRCAGILPGGAATRLATSKAKAEAEVVLNLVLVRFVNKYPKGQLHPRRLWPDRSYKRHTCACVTRS